MLTDSVFSQGIIPWTQDVNRAYLKRSEDVLVILVRSINELYSRRKESRHLQNVSPKTFTYLKTIQNNVLL